MLLGAVTGLGAGLLGCEDAPPRAVRRRIDPDDPVKAAAVADIRSVLAAYDANLAAFPTLGNRLAPLRVEHEAHLRALGASPTPAASTPAVSTPAVASAVTAAPAAAAVPAALAVREQAAAELRLQQAIQASAGLARLLAGIGAAEASHAAVLRAPA